jgi:hypothetical protein
VIRERGKMKVLGVTRLALLGAATIIGFGGVPVAHGGGFTMGQRVARAYGAVSRYKGTSEFITTRGGKSLTARAIWIVIGRGAAKRMYGQIRSFPPTHSPEVPDEDYFASNTKTCTRVVGSSWHCTVSKGTPTDPLASLVEGLSAGVFDTQQVRFVASGTRVIEGTTCTAYRVLLPNTGASGGSIIVYIATTTSLPVEVDIRSASAAQAGSPATQTLRCEVFSNYNDPHLTIPLVPGS